MTSPFEKAGFTTYRLPQAAQQAFAANPYGTSPVSQPAAAPSAPSTDTYTPNSTIDKDALKEELRQEIINEMKAEQELENKAKAAEEKKKNKLGPIKRFKRFIGNVKKAVVTAGEYTKGFFKGILTGGIAGGAVGGSIFALGKVAKDPASLINVPVAGKLLRDTKLVVNADKIAASLPAKILANKKTAIIAGGVVLAIGLISSLWKASLNANEKRALIEHRYENTPVTRK